jgi:beta-1,4-mannosyltransferase
VRATPPTVLFQVTAIGRNVRALDTTVRSVLYWLRNTPRLPFRARIWVVLEPEGYATDPAVYESLRRAGAEIMVIPATYETRLGTHGKARGLQYACDRRQAAGLSSPDVWVYHQDEETCVGQDTLRGIADFLREGRGLVGVGVILYPLDWAGLPSHIQELTRTYDDLRVLDSMTQPGNPTVGFHGSHILIRADAEDSVGWDSRGYAPAEDLTFEIRMRARYGSVFGVLRGFAYEKGAFTLRDQLRQRRRWVHGVLHALVRSPELPLRRRLTLAYSLASWFTALPSLALLVTSIVIRYGPLLVVTGLFTGFVWTSMLLGYVEGYRIHAEYIDRSIPKRRLIPHGIAGSLVDVCAPWYALLTRPSLGDFVVKDRPAVAPQPAPRSRSTGGGAHGAGASVPMADSH